MLENEAFDPRLIDYSDSYENSQAHSPRFLSHMRSVLDLLKDEFPKNSKIVEVGCGKGDFVEMLQKDGTFKITGYDASYEGDSALIEKRYLDESDCISADLIVLRHVLEHVPNPYNFLTLLKNIFGDAKIYIEVPNYDWIVKNKTFFDITYEHVNYFSQNSLLKLFDDPAARHGLMFEDQYQFVIAPVTSLNIMFDQYYQSADWKFLTFEDLFPDMNHCIERLDQLAEGRSVYVWGAATKGCLFLTHCMNQQRLIDKVRFAIDQNPQKIGKFLPGSYVPIKSKEDFIQEAEAGDVLIISNEAYKEEIVSYLDKSDVKDLIIETL